MLAGSNLHFEIAERTRAIDVGGVPAMHALAIRLGLKREIDERVQVLKVHKPYHESDHVMNIALNVLAGGTCLEDLGTWSCGATTRAISMRSGRSASRAWPQVGTLPWFPPARPASSNSEAVREPCTTT